MFFGKNEGQPVDVVCVESTFVEGKLLEAGTVAREMPHELALELASAGKVRKATPELLAELKAAKAAAQKQAEARAQQDAQRVAATQGATAELVAAAVASALQAAGIGTAPKA